MIVDLGFILSVALFFLLILVSGFYSGSEVALFSLSPTALEKMRERGTTADLRVIKLLESPRRLLVSILVGNSQSGGVPARDSLDFVQNRSGALGHTDGLRHDTGKLHQYGQFLVFEA